MNQKLKTYFTANKMKYPNKWGIIYNILFSIKGRAVIYVYYCAHNNNVLSFFIRRRLKEKYHIEVGNPVKIGDSLILNHPYNIIIDANVYLGNRCQIDQNVTIGGNMKKVKKKGTNIQTRPIIKNDVILCSGCLVAGPIEVGDNCIIGANATVTFDVNEGSIVSNVSKVSSKRVSVRNGSYHINN